MFGNLVRIELIRLFRSRILKYSLSAGLFLMLADYMIIEYAISLGGLTFLDDPEYGTTLAFKVFTYLFIAGFMIGVVSPLTVIVTTCGYYKHRLAINIEGANRNRLKLWASELAGIAVFVVALCITIFPGLILCVLLEKPSDIVALFTDKDIAFWELSLVVVLSTIALSYMAYMMAKLFLKASMAVALSVIFEVVMTMVMTFGIGIISKYRNTGHVIPQFVETGLIVTSFVLPIVVLIILILVKYRKLDRI